MTAARVFDASAIAAMLITEPVSDEVDGLVSGPGMSLAPDYAITECANALWKRWMRGEMDAEDVAERLLELERYPIDFSDTMTLLPPALLMAMRTRHTLYDCIYIALAEQQGAELITVDARQAEAAHEVGVRARLVEPE